MALPIYQQISTTGTATAVLLDYAQTPFNVSYAVELLNSTATFEVDFTLDNLNAKTDMLPGTTTVTWFTDVNSGTTATASVVGNYMFPVRALRVNVHSGGAGLSMQFAVLQGYPNF